MLVDGADLRQGVLTIRDTKFGKSRLVPVHPTTREALLRYEMRRDEHSDRRSSPYFFVTERGRRLLVQYVHRVFWTLSRRIGLRGPTDHTGPRLHDLRHRFAIQTLLGWYRAGEDVGRLMRQRNVSPHTIGSYRDTFRLLFAFAREHLGKAPSTLDLRDVDSALISAFLDHTWTHIGRRMLLTTSAMPERQNPSDKASEKAVHVIARVSTEPRAALMASRL
jgi:site-specific recombinase XerD